MRILKYKQYTYTLGRAPSRGRAMRGFAALRKPQQGLWFTRIKSQIHLALLAPPTLVHVPLLRRATTIPHASDCKPMVSNIRSLLYSIYI
jgi:hypothetical protein